MELLRYSLCGWILLIGKPLDFFKDHAVVACLKTFVCKEGQRKAWVV